MAVYVYACTGNRYETDVPGFMPTPLSAAQPPREYGTCEQGQGAWLLYEKETVNLELIQLGLAGLCVLCVALGWMAGSQR